MGAIVGQICSFERHCWLGISKYHLSKPASLPSSFTAANYFLRHCIGFNTLMTAGYLLGAEAHLPANKLPEKMYSFQRSHISYELSGKYSSKCSNLDIHLLLAYWSKGFSEHKAFWSWSDWKACSAISLVHECVHSLAEFIEPIWGKNNVLVSPKKFLKFLTVTIKRKSGLLFRRHFLHTQQ